MEKAKKVKSIVKTEVKKGKGFTPPTFPTDQEIVTKAWGNIFPEPLEKNQEKAIEEGLALGRGSVRLGGRLLVIKEQIPHGGWEQWIAEIFPLGADTARNLMGLARAFGDKPELVDRIGKTKAVALLRDGLSSYDYDPEKDEIGGHSIDEIAGLSAPELRDKLRKQKKKNEALGIDNIDMEQKLAEAERAAHPIPNRYEDALDAIKKMRKHTILSLGVPHPFLDNPKVDETIGRLFFEAMAGMAKDIIDAMQYFEMQEHIKPFDLGHLNITDSQDFLKDHGVTDKDLGIE